MVVQLSRARYLCHRHCSLPSKNAEGLSGLGCGRVGPLFVCLQDRRLGLALPIWFVLKLVFDRFLSNVPLVPFLIMGRVTYIHHYLPTLYFAVLMVGHLFDHFIFKSRRLKDTTKWVVFAIAAGTVIGVFWWFRAVAFGIDGPIKEHKGLLWRKVRVSFACFE